MQVNAFQENWSIRSEFQNLEKVIKDSQVPVWLQCSPFCRQGTIEFLIVSRTFPFHSEHDSFDQMSQKSFIQRVQSSLFNLNTIHGFVSRLWLRIWRYSRFAFFSSSAFVSLIIRTRETMFNSRHRTFHPSPWNASNDSSWPIPLPTLSCCSWSGPRNDRSLYFVARDLFFSLSFSSFDYLFTFAIPRFFLLHDLFLSIFLLFILHFLLFFFVLPFCIHPSSDHRNFLLALVGRSSVLLLRNCQPKMMASDQKSSLTLWQSERISGSLRTAVKVGSWFNQSVRRVKKFVDQEVDQINKTEWEFTLYRQR
jgi:hypothetical protein